MVFEAERGNALRCGPPRKGGVGRNNPKEFVSVRVAANALESGLYLDPLAPVESSPSNLFGASFAAAPTSWGAEG